LGDRILLLGGKPAGIIKEYPVNLDRSKRREKKAFVDLVEEVKNGLQTAIVAATEGSN